MTVGIAPNSFVYWKKRGTIPQADVAVAIAAALNTTVEYLVTGKDSADPWLRENSGFIQDCKQLDAAQFSTVQALVKLQADEIRRKKGISGAAAG